MTQTAGLVAGRYQLESRIAAGGVGEVWRAVDLVLDRPVAVKLLRSEYAGQPQALARFRAEARHAAALSHPGIAQIYDYGEAGPAELPYLVMELVSGPSLADVLAARPLDPASAMDVVAQAAAGLQAAHAAGLVHRDIKPANLLVGPAGQMKITDFGIAHAAGSVPITRIGTVVGTPAYLAPERCAGSPATPASDLYSLGVVGYECLTGAVPFSGMPIEVTAAHQHQPLPPLPPEVPEEAAGLIGRLTAKDPAVRPSAAEAAEHAGRLRDALAVGPTTQLSHVMAASIPLVRVNADPVTRVLPASAFAAGPAAAGGHARRRQPGTARPRPRALVAVAGAALVAGLAGWLIVGAFPASSPSRPRTPPAGHSPASPAVRSVNINADVGIGQPVDQVSQALTQLGLTPQVVWVASNDAEPGTVISVHPSGPVPAGSVVTLTAALQPAGHHHGHDGGGQGGG
jgi:eukaryotic-like serine/threonine-protein kinase